MKKLACLIGCLLFGFCLLADAGQPLIAPILIVPNTIGGTFSSSTFSNSSFANGAANNVTINGYVECADNPTISSAVVTISNASCTFHKLNMVSNTTVTLPAPVAGQSYSVLTCANGAWTPTFTMASGVLAWPAATAPTATATNGKCDLYNFASHGTTYLFGQDGGRNFTAN